MLYSWECNRIGLACVTDTVLNGLRAQLSRNERWYSPILSTAVLRHLYLYRFCSGVWYGTDVLGQCVPRWATACEKAHSLYLVQRGNRQLENADRRPERSQLVVTDYCAHQMLRTVTVAARNWVHDAAKIEHTRLSTAIICGAAADRSCLLKLLCRAVEIWHDYSRRR